MSLLPPSAPGLDEPLEMLSACHDRVRAQLATLARLAQWLPQHGADEQATRAALAVMRYFDLAAVNHHLDEEKDLLPAMLEAVDPAGRERLQSLVQRILAEHVELATRWAGLRALLEKVAQGECVPLDEDLIRDFTSAYDVHIRLEEEEILPWAERLLAADVLASISVTMTDRRRAPSPSVD